MRRLAVMGLMAVLLFPAGAAAQDEVATPPRDEAVYQGPWCLYLSAHPYYLGAPSDVVCEYVARAMTDDEAGDDYLWHVVRQNYVGDQMGCALKKAKDGLSWSQQQKWAKRLLEAQRLWGETLTAVEWPDDATRAVRRLVERNQAESYWRREVYNHKTLLQAALSSDNRNYNEAASKTGEAAAQVRLTLGLNRPPRGNDCTQVKRHEKRLRGIPAFENPFADPDLKRVAALLADAGLVESRMNESGVNALFLTEEGIETARAMPTIDDEASGEEVVAALFGPPPAPVAEPSPQAETVELVPPSPQVTPDSADG